MSEQVFLCCEITLTKVASSWPRELRDEPGHSGSERFQHALSFDTPAGWTTREMGKKAKPHKHTVK